MSNLPFNGNNNDGDYSETYPFNGGNNGAVIAWKQRWQEHFHLSMAISTYGLAQAHPTLPCILLDNYLSDACTVDCYRLH